MKYADLPTEYTKNPQLKRADVKALEEWLSKQSHLPTITELQIILFLQSCNFNQHLARQTIDTYFTIKTHCSDIFGNRVPSKLKDAMEVYLYTALPRRTPEGYTILFLRMFDSNPEHFNLAAQVKLFDMSTILHLHQNGTSEGHLMVIDMDKVLFGHLTRLSPVVIKKFLYYLQDAMPVRLKGLHFFNIVSFMDKIVAVLKPFMKKELFDMLYLHDDVKSLSKYVPIECLPAEYGGECGSATILHEKMKSAFHDHAAFFGEEEKQKVDENRRAGNGRNISDIFGMEGTFKKLDID